LIHVSYGHDIWLGGVVYPRTISPEPKLLVVAKRHGFDGLQYQWFNYTEIAVW